LGRVHGGSILLISPEKGKTTKQYQLQTVPVYLESITYTQ